MRTRLALALVAAGLSLAAADSAAASRFFQFNMCGSVRGGECNGGETNPVAGAITASILDFKPHAVSLNEACRSQVRAVARRLRRAGRRMRFRWVQTEFSNNCPGDKFGNAVLTTNRITGSSAWRLRGDPGEEVRKLLCVRTRVAGRRRTRVCSTHIETSSDRGDQRAQIREVTNRVSRYSRNGVPVVLMGDFNVTPGDRLLNRLYRRFKETDQFQPCSCHEATIGSSKLDYIFFSRRHWKGIRGDATFSDHSDHDPLRGWARRG